MSRHNILFSTRNETNSTCNLFNLHLLYNVTIIYTYKLGVFIADIIQSLLTVVGCLLLISQHVDCRLAACCDDSRLAEN